MRSRWRALGLAWLLAALLGPGAAAAQIYRWVDEAGTPHFVEGLDSVPERYRGSATPLGLRNAPVAPPAPGPAAVTQPRGVTVVRYPPGQRIMVDVRINGATSARLVLDTGADRTIIGPSALRAAGVSLTRILGTAQVVGVTGSDRLPFVMLDSLEVGEARVAPMPVGAYQIPQSEGDGLLGRDFLDRFHITIDAARGQVTLAPK